MQLARACRVCDWLLSAGSEPQIMWIATMRMYDSMSFTFNGLASLSWTSVVFAWTGRWCRCRPAAQLLRSKWNRDSADISCLLPGAQHLETSMESHGAQEWKDSAHGQWSMMRQMRLKSGDTFGYWPRRRPTYRISHISKYGQSTKVKSWCTLHGRTEDRLRLQLGGVAAFLQANVHLR